MATHTPRGAFALRAKGSHRVGKLVGPRDWLDRGFSIASKLAALEHAALPPTIDCSFVDDTLEIVWAPRPSLKPISVREVETAILAVADVADAIALVHAAPGERVACGPLSPALVAADREGAQVLGLGLWALGYALDMATRGAMMTTRHFVLSPEELGGAVSLATDTYWLGHLLYELLAGREPYPVETELEYMQAVKGGQSTSLQLLRPDLPIDLETILRRAMALDPSARPSAAQLATDLRAFVGVDPRAEEKPWWKVW